MIQNLPTLVAYLDDQGSPAFTRLFQSLPSLAIQYYWLKKSITYPEVIYHYTSVEKFSMILNSDTSHVKLLLAELEALNDSFEGQYAIGRLCEPHSDLWKLFLEVKLRMAASSMSAQPDQAQLWLAYGDRGKGVSIGFRTSVVSTMNQDAYFPGLIYICYDDSEIFPFYDFLNCNIVRAEWTHRDFSAEDAIKAAVLSSFKYKDFYFEDEFRLAALNGKFDVHFGSGGPRRVKFQRLKHNLAFLVSHTLGEQYSWSQDESAFLDKQGQLPIAEVVIGNNIGSVGKRALSEYCERHSITWRPSSVPLQ